jgi:hypothetical protein
MSSFVRSLLLAGFAIGSPAFGVSYTFDSPTYNTTDTSPADGYGDVRVHGQDGWATTGATGTTPGIDFLVDPSGGVVDYWGAVGGLFSVAPVRNVELSHSAAAPLSALKITADFSIVESDPTVAAGRDSFGFTIRDGASQLMRVAFEPGVAGKMEIVWYSPTNVRTSSGLDLSYGSLNSFSLMMSPSGMDTAFTASVTGLSPAMMTGILPGTSAANVTSFAVDYDVDPAVAVSANGSNYIMVNNLNIIPEPASVSALALGALAMFRRRRTA